MADQINLNDLIMRDGSNDNEKEFVRKFYNERKKPVVTDEVTVFFDEIKANLIREIKQSELVLGCVAWLTDFDILEALSKVPSVVICVQKEDFLRPDVGVKANDKAWRLKLRNAYDKLKHDRVSRLDFSPILREANRLGEEGFDHSVVCVGNYNRDKNPAFPRMHNKFLVMSDSKEFVPSLSTLYNSEYDVRNGHNKLTKVWTGSFNFTQNAGRSFENALLLTNPEIVQAYFLEWQYIMMFSEDLNWYSDWTEPELRIGS